MDQDKETKIKAFIEENKGTMTRAEINTQLKKRFGVKLLKLNKYVPHTGQRQRDKAELKRLKAEEKLS